MSDDSAIVSVFMVAAVAGVFGYFYIKSDKDSSRRPESTNNSTTTTIINDYPILPTSYYYDSWSWRSMPYRYRYPYSHFYPGRRFGSMLWSHRDSRTFTIGDTHYNKRYGTHSFNNYNNWRDRIDSGGYMNNRGLPTSSPAGSINPTAPPETFNNSVTGGGGNTGGVVIGG